jgi:hypothetical protein
MKHRRFLVALFVALALIATASTGSARLKIPHIWDHLTLVTAEAWEYPDVRVEWLPDSSALLVTRADGARRLFPLERVAALRTADGRDVTAEVLGGPSSRPVVPPEPAPAAPVEAPPATPATPAMPEVPTAPATPETPPPLPGPRFHWSLSGGGGYGVTAGDGFGEAEGEQSWFGKLRIASSPHTYVVLGARYQKLPRSTPLYDLPVYVGDDIVVFSDQVELEHVFIGFGFMPRPANYLEPVPYLELGMGRVASGSSAWLFHLEDQEPGGGEESHSAPALHVEAGLLVPVGDILGLELGVSWIHADQRLFPARHGRFDDDLLGVQAGVSLLGGVH